MTAVTDSGSSRERQRHAAGAAASGNERIFHPDFAVKPFWWDEAPRGCKGDFPR